MPDDELYSLFLAGDTSAVDKLIEKYSGRLVMYADAMIHDIQDAEDLVIESFAVIMTRRPAIRSGGFQAYLYQTVRRRAVRFHALRRRMNVFSLDEEQAEELQAVRPEDEFLRNEQRRAVRRCMNRISPECREAIWLVFFEGLSYTEAASVMGVNNKKVDNLLAKGKREMKEELIREGITRAREE